MRRTMRASLDTGGVPLRGSTPSTPSSSCPPTSPAGTSASAACTRMRGGSFESYDEAFASEGVVAGDAIDPDRGSVDPFLPRQRSHEGHARLQGRLA